MNIYNARKILGVTSKDSLRDIILNYLKSLDEKDNDNVVNAKNTLVGDYIKKNLMFDPMRAVLPINESCNGCNGLGLRVRYIQSESEIICPACGGNGRFIVRCNKCEGGVINLSLIHI